MTKQLLSIDGAWNVLVCYGVQPQDLTETAGMMIALGADREQVARAWETLEGCNGGVTYTSFNRLTSLVFIGHAESAREMFNTIDHEIDHVQDHVARYYGVTLGTEQAAYLQGFIGGRLWEFVFTELLN